jgi:hypothetical protein
MKKSQLLLTAGLLVSLLLIYTSITVFRDVYDVNATAESGDLVAVSSLGPGSITFSPGMETGNMIRITLVTGLVVLTAVVLLGGLTFLFGRGRNLEGDIENRQRVKKASSNKQRSQHAA